MKVKDFKKEYINPANPVAKSSQKYIDDLISNAKRRGGERQLDARVGDRVWCRFSYSPNRVLNPGTVIRIEIDDTMTVYTVIADNSVDYECFTGEDFGKTIFDEMDAID